ncbi:MAG: cytochrome c biogenesis protein ResB [Actinobacteria bacterium]|nr:cytochrome c biogenesis protein ResB [Actinomycetota bacterium]
MSNRIWKFITSVKLALVLIIALTAVSTYGVTANKAIFSTRWFIALGILFLVSTTACTWLQIRRAIRNWKDIRSGGPIRLRENAALGFETIGGLAAGLRSLEADLKRRRYRVRITEEDGEIALRASKYAAGVWGAPLFHVGLVLILVGGLVSLTTKLWGSFGVIEGTTFSDHRQNFVVYNKGLWASDQHDRFRLRLDKVDLFFAADGHIHDYVSEVTLYDGQGKEEVGRGRIGGAYTVSYGSLTFYKRLFGYAPAFTLRDPDRTDPMKFMVAIDTTQTGPTVDADLQEPLLTYQGEFAVPQTPYRVRATFFPDFTGPREKPVFKSHRPEDPGVFLEISDGKRSVFRGLIRPGENADFDGKSLTFDFYKLWYGFSVTEDWGVPVVYGGFGLATFGAFLAYFVVPRRIWVTPGRSDDQFLLRVTGSSSKYAALFREEFADIIKKSLKSGITE